jgi:hypothetical protein
LLSKLRPPKLSCSAAARIVLAAMLALALLAGVVPFNVLSSSEQQTCAMSCCAGKPPHNAGSCSTAFSGDGEKAQTSGAAVAEEHAHTEGMQAAGASTQIIEADSECAAPQRSTDEHASQRDASRRATSVTAHALTTPCSQECAAATSANASGQVRRPRNAALLAESNRPRPTLHACPSERSTNLQVLSARIGRQSSPRAPPLFFSENPSA